MNVILNVLYDIGKFLVSKFLLFFKWLIKDYKRIIIAILICLLGYLLIKVNHISKSYYDYQQRSIDTLSVYKNKIGELYQAEATYIMNERDLRKKNKDLYDELKSLKDNPIVIVKTLVEVKRDTVALTYEPATEIKNGKDSIFEGHFHFEDQWMKVLGTTHFSTADNSFSSVLNSIKLTSDITTNLIERDNKLYFISKSSNPYIQINNLEGCVLSPEDSKVINKHYDKRWALVIGAGPSVSVVNGNLKVFPAVQLTLGYKLISF